MADRMAARTSLRKAVDGVFVAIGDGLANGEEARTAGNSGPSAPEADRPLRGVSRGQARWFRCRCRHRRRSRPGKR